MSKCTWNKGKLSIKLRYVTLAAESSLGCVRLSRRWLCGLSLVMCTCVIRAQLLPLCAGGLIPSLTGLEKVNISNI